MIAKLDSELRDTSKKLENQKYWSQTYQENCKELSEQVKSVSTDLRNTKESFEVAAADLQKIKCQLRDNEHLSTEIKEAIGTNIDSVCGLIEERAIQCQSLVSQSKSKRESKKVKSAKTAAQLAGRVSDAGRLQANCLSEMTKLWQLSEEETELRIKTCRDQYFKLASGAAEVLQSGFDCVEEVTRKQQDEWNSALCEIRSQDVARQAVLQSEHDRLLDRKRKVEAIHKEAGEKQKQVLLRIQTTIRTLVQVRPIGEERI